MEHQRSGFASGIQGNKEETASVLRCCRCCACLGQRQPWQLGWLAPASKNGGGGAVPVCSSAGIRWSHASRRGGDVPPGAAATHLHAYTRRVRTTLLGRVRDASGWETARPSGGRLYTAMTEAGGTRCKGGQHRVRGHEQLKKVGGGGAYQTRIRNCLNYSKIKKQLDTYGICIRTYPYPQEGRKPYPGNLSDIKIMTNHRIDKRLA